MRRQPPFLLVCLAFALAGCIQTEYELELTPSGTFVERHLKIKRNGRQASSEELGQLGKMYQTAPPPSAKEQELKKHFSGRLPDDVGGHGSFVAWETPLGSAAIYLERFRGNDDAASEFKRREAAAERLGELLTGWLEGELKTDPQWPKLRKFLQEDFRRDLYNLGIYSWMVGLNGHSESNPEGLARAVQYLVERGYVSLHEIPAFRRAVIDGAADPLLKFLRRILTAKVREEGMPPPTLEFLAGPEQLQKSLRGYLERQPAYATLEAAWEQQRKLDPDAQRPDALEVLNEPCQMLFAGAIQLGGDRLTLSLKTSQPAIATNGQWKPESGHLLWPARGLPEEHGPPSLTYAVIATPSEATQKTHFGSTPLQGKRLLDYAIWYHGLTAAERKEWDDFVAKLKPGPELPTQLSSFRFAHEPTSLTAEQRLAHPAVHAIREGR